VLGDREMQAFRAGDPDALRAVYEQYGRLVFAVSFKVLGDQGLAEEATQQAFIQAWRNAQTFDSTREMAPWLATIARRAAIDIHRREARREHDRLDDQELHPALINLPESVESAYEVWEVRKAVDELPADERDVVRMQHLEGMSHSEIAGRLGVPPGTVKSRSYRAHRQLAARLGHLRGDIG
jgi:RNA polymerase sigma factor (sigma-70 family)